MGGMEGSGLMIASAILISLGRVVRVWAVAVAGAATAAVPPSPRTNSAVRYFERVAAAASEQRLYKSLVVAVPLALPPNYLGLVGLMLGPGSRAVPLARPRWPAARPQQQGRASGSAATVMSSTTCLRVISLP